MKAKFLFLLFFIGTFTSYSQTPLIKWQLCVGGSDDDEASQVLADENGNILLGGTTFSNDGDMQLVAGYGNAALVSIDSSGIILSSKCYGGENSTKLNSFITINHNRRIICGSTYSFDFPNYHQTSGNSGTDAVLISVDSLGNSTWVNCFGSYDNDIGTKVKQCNDGGFIFVGEANSNGGDVHGHYGFEDWWVVKTDSVGNIIWSKCLGGTAPDIATSICQLRNGSYVVTGGITSVDGDISCTSPGSNNRVVILDSLGNILRDDCYGSPLGTAGWDLIPTDDGGYIFGGGANGNGGDVSGNHGQYDFWVYKADSSGQILWSKCYGGSMDDGLISMQKSRDGGYILVGRSNSNPNNNPSNDDVLVVKIDSSGNQEWMKFLGGTEDEFAKAATELINGDVIVIATTRSTDLDLAGVPQHGFAGFNDEIWVVDLALSTSIASIPNSFESTTVIHKPNGFQVMVYSEKSEPVQVSVVDVLGRDLLRANEFLIHGENELFVPYNSSLKPCILILSSENDEKRFKLF